MRSPRLGILLIAVGALLMVTGAVGLALTPATPETTSASPSPDTGSPSPAGSPTVEPTKAPAQLETPEQFVPELAAAIRAGNQRFLFRRLHPAVLERYGEEQCRSAMEGFDDPSFELEVQSSRGPHVWPWRTDGLTTRVPGTFDVNVIRRVGGEEDNDVVHVALEGTQLRWFTDCGDPI
jgi:hypothetical protein